MKRRMVCCLLVFLLGFGCAPAAPAAEVTPVATEAPAPTEAPTPTFTPEPTPEPVGVAPIDLFSAPYNVFADIAFPAGYTVFGARFDSADPPKSAYARYALYLTAEGNPKEIALYFAGLLGITDESKLAEIADTMDQEMAQDIYGTYLGVPAFAMLKKTEAGYDYDQCTDVAGCRIELAVDIPADQTALYNNLILKNNNTAILGDFAPQLGEDTILKDLMSIYVNRVRPEKTEVYLLHRVDNAETLMATFGETLSPAWFDEPSKTFGLNYSRISGKYRFDTEHNIVFATLSPNDNSTPAGEFVKSEQSLFGFGFQPEDENGIYLYDDKASKVRIEIANPESAARPEWDMGFLFISNDYIVVMWYDADQKSLVIQTDKGDISAKCRYHVDTQTFDDFWPSEEMVLENLTKALGKTDGDVRLTAVERMATEVQSRFGVDWQALYALPVW